MRIVPQLALAGLLACFPNIAGLQGQNPETRVAEDYQASDSLDTKFEAADENAKRSLVQLQWEPSNFRVSVQAAPSNPSDADFLVRFPSPRPIGNEAVDRVCCEWYCHRSLEDAPTPAVIVIHESGSGMVVGRTFAQELRRRGVHAFLLHMPGYGERKLKKSSVDDMIAVFRQGVADARRARDAIAVLPGVDENRIGLQGTSLGGFVASLVAGLDDGFDCVFLCLSGGDLHSVLTSGQREARKAKERLLALGIKEDELKDRLAPLEPLTLAPRLNPSKTWLYSATFDQVVPPRNSLLLAKAIGLSEDHHVQLLATHYSGVIYLPGICDKVVKIVGGEGSPQ